MSVDRTAMIVRGFEVDKETWESLDDNFKDDWGINFDNWCDRGPYFIGYRIQTCSEGKLYPLSTHSFSTHLDSNFIEACRNANLEMTGFGSYFGVAVW